MSARFWTAPVLWRFEVGRTTWPGRGKAAEDCLTPRRFACRFSSMPRRISATLRVLTATSVSCASSQSRTGCTLGIFTPRPVPPVPGDGLRRLHFRHGGHPPAALRLFDKVLLSRLCALDAQAAILIGGTEWLPAGRI